MSNVKYKILLTHLNTPVKIVDETYNEVREKIRQYLKYKIPGVYTMAQANLILGLTNLYFLLNEKETKISFRNAFRLINDLCLFAENMVKSEDLRVEFETDCYINKNGFSKTLIRIHYINDMIIDKDLDWSKEERDSFEKSFNLKMSKLYWYIDLLEAIETVIRQLYNINVVKACHTPKLKTITKPEGEEKMKYKIVLGKGRASSLPEVEKVYNNKKEGTTIVVFKNGDKIRVTREKDDKDDLEKAIAIAMVKYAYGLDKYLDACDKVIDSTKKEKLKKTTKNTKDNEKIKLEIKEKMLYLNKHTLPLKKK